MIAEQHKNEIRKLRNRRKISVVIPYIIFIFIFLTSYYFRFEYSEKTDLFNDKVIDVSAIFFGVFIGSLYLFEKFKNNKTYKDFLRFCKIILLQNIIIIGLSFLIILINEKLVISILISDFMIYPKSIIFSFYVAFCSTTLLNIVRFIKIVLKILESSK